ncbi:MAG TPA: hypothetical protein VK178_07085 [Opitutaceae bacterium]|nr:hypothetical protein [Opitutaceae bacterium]
MRDLRGLRLALYDEALAAGARGRTAAELRAATAEEALRMGLRPEAYSGELQWLLDHHLLHEYQTGKYRARSREEAVALNAGRERRNTEERNPEGECGNQEIRNLKPEAAPAAPAVAQLRTPVFAPRLARRGQGTFF